MTQTGLAAWQCMVAMQSSLGHATNICHPKYSILYGALMLFMFGSGQE
jgi:hypothetical protein